MITIAGTMITIAGGIILAVLFFVFLPQNHTRCLCSVRICPYRVRAYAPGRLAGPGLRGRARHSHRRYADLHLCAS